MPEVINIHEELRKDHARIGNATSALAKASRAFDGWLDQDTGELIKGVRQRYQELYDDALVDLEERYLKDERKLPAQDIRKARITKQLRKDHPTLCDEYWSLEGTINNLQRTISGRKVAISAAQSVLRGERD